MIKNWREVVASVDIKMVIIYKNNKNGHICLIFSVFWSIVFMQCDHWALLCFFAVSLQDGLHNYFLYNFGGIFFGFE